MSGRVQRLSWLSCAALVACAGAASERAGVASPASSGAASALSGEWSEYWSVAGQAQTERYTFLDNGEFRWAAAPSVSAPASGTPLLKQGSFELRQTAQQRWLVLHVASTELAGCDSACEGEGEQGAFRIEHAPALLEELELSECPPNADAQHIDEQYACLALGDRAFWRKAVAVSGAAQPTR